MTQVGNTMVKQRMRFRETYRCTKICFIVTIQLNKWEIDWGLNCIDRTMMSAFFQQFHVESVEWWKIMDRVMESIDERKVDRG